MTWRRAVLAIAGIAPIGILLGHLWALAPMARLALPLGLPSVLALVWIRRSAGRAGDSDCLARLRAGLLGGLWGTLGYDLVRIPFHHAGQNPFAPIRAYGLWLADGTFSTPATDLLGLAYHLSNGIGFGWIYAALALGRPWGWGILWGLLLETLAVLSPFGEVFALRQAYGSLALAYAAHVFYGLPLGLVCRRPEAFLPGAFPLHRTAKGWGTLAALALLGIWFLSAWQPIRPPGAMAPALVVAGPDALYPGWLHLPAGSAVVVENRLPRELPLRLRRPDGRIEVLRIMPRGSLRLVLASPGIHQIAAAGTSWRSVFLSVHRGEDCRPRLIEVPPAPSGP